MKPSLRERGIPIDNDFALRIDPIVTPNQESLQRSSGLGFWKKLSVAVGMLIAIVATSGWLYSLASNLNGAESFSG
jgi:hypothetical protein